MKATADRFNRKLRELYSREKARKLIEDEATSAAVILGEPMKHLGQKAAFGNDPIQEIHFLGMPRPSRYRLQRRPNAWARVAWRNNGETVRAWIKVTDDGRWVVSPRQIIEMNKEVRNEHETGSASGPA